MCRSTILIAATWAVVVGAAGLLSADDRADFEFFEKKIRPVLVQHCYECHSAKAGEIKAELSLDSRAAMLQGGESGPVLTPGKPDESILLEALRYASFEMPPNGRLSKEIVADFETWIRRGAPDPRKDPPPAAAAQPKSIDIEAGRTFWALQPLRRFPVPHTTSDWPRTDIDRFIAAAWEQAGLTPPGDANRSALLRRLTYDLTGLPPRADEIKRFLEDASPQAVENVVDRLLSTPQYGEHWGRHWLDVARYADSNGSDFNATFHEAWRYRDYVVRAINQDKPFDVFVREQIAGDLLPFENDQQQADQTIATGFLMVGTKMLSERDKEKLQMDVVDEQIDAVGRAFMGLTLGCARCHDHKFDPVPTKDYYALAGIFRSTTTLKGESQQYVSTWKTQPLPVAPAQAEAWKRHLAAKQAFEKKVKVAQADLKRSTLHLAHAERPGVIVDDQEAIIVGAWKSSTSSPHYVGEGYIHDNRSEQSEKRVTFIPRLPHAGEYEVRISYTWGDSRANDVPITITHAGGAADLRLNQTKKPEHDDLFTTLGRFPFKAGRESALTISNAVAGGYVIVDAVQFLPVQERVVQKAARPKADNELSMPVVQARKAVQQAEGDLKQAEKRLKAFNANAPESPPRAMAVSESGAIGDCAICIRGNHRQRGAKTPRGFLQVASTETPPVFTSHQSGRAELARWIGSAKHPLTARVFVNRVWSHLLGEGIVRSVDNFGRLGERPTHPALLDYLATTFIEDAWSLKHLTRRIVLSRAYQMSSDFRQDAQALDPDNRLLSRARRRRLAAEDIRDSLLLVSGKMNFDPASSPVAGLGVLVNNNSSNEKAYAGGASNHRSIYLPVVRNELPPLLTAFDFPDREVVVGKRAATNVPAQALLLLNSPFVIDCAATTASNLLSEALHNDRQRMTRAYLSIYGRKPSESEINHALSFLQQVLHAETNKTDPTETKLAAGNARKEAWRRCIQALFASTEFRLLD